MHHHLHAFVRAAGVLIASASLLAATAAQAAETQAQATPNATKAKATAKKATAAQKAECAAGTGGSKDDGSNNPNGKKPSGPKCPELAGKVATPAAK